MMKFEYVVRYQYGIAIDSGEVYRGSQQSAAETVFCHEVQKEMCQSMGTDGTHAQFFLVLLIDGKYHTCLQSVIVYRNPPYALRSGKGSLRDVDLQALEADLAELRYQFEDEKEEVK